jgi:3-hydroxybutyryl-CoA dehydrogenase
MAVGLLGTGSYVPDRVVTNEEIAALVPDAPVEWILRRTGISTRRWAAPEEATSDLGTSCCSPRATRDPGRVVGLHFFNPVPVMPLVELVSSLRTSAATIARASSFVVEVLGKQLIRAKDQAGFVVNSLLVPYLLAAVRALEAGGTSAEDIDRGMTLGCGHPMGPLALVDFIGLDTIASVGEAMYEETKEPLYAPPTLLLRMIEGGFLGRKSGRGFYAH